MKLLKIGQMLKTCSKCRAEKDAAAFYKRGGKRKHLLYSWCRDCIRGPSNKRNRKYYRTTRSDQYRKDPIQYLLKVAESRAKKYGVTFSVIREDIEVPTHCPITGEKLDVLTNDMSSGMSLDKIDNTQGYVKGNVCVISRKANRLKSDGSIEDFRKIIAYMEKNSCPTLI